METTNTHLLNQLLEDWAPGRSAETFVHRDETRSTGWEKKTRKGLSGYIKKIKPVELLTVGYRLCSARLRTMTGGRRYKLTFSPSESCTDGREVFVSTDVADDKKLGANSKLDVMLGLTVHEVLHILYTDWAFVPRKSRLEKTIFNVIEDERIEMKGGLKWPGFALYLAKVKDYYFNVTYAKKKLPNETAEIFDSFFKFVRYPKHLDISLVEKHIEVLTAIKNILTPFPATCEEVAMTSRSILHLLKDPARDQNQTTTAHNNKSEQNESEKNWEKTSEAFSELDSPNDNGAPTVEIEKLRENKASKEFADNDPITCAVIDGSATMDEKTIFIKAKGDSGKTKFYLNETRKHSRILGRILKTDGAAKSIVETSLREGNLDENKIAELIAGSSQVYEQRQVIEARGPAIVLLIDESGSMDMIPEGFTKKKIEYAAECGVMIEQATRLSPNSLFFAYGFTTAQEFGSEDLITIYIEPGVKSYKSNFGSMTAKSGNRDGVCIRKVADRVRAFTNRGCIFIVVSDGMPNYTIDGRSGIDDTRQAVEEISKKGFHPLQIGIGTSPEIQAQMFDDYVTYSDPRTMVNDLRKIIVDRTRKKKYPLRDAA